MIKRKTVNKDTSVLYTGMYKDINELLYKYIPMYKYILMVNDLRHARSNTEVARELYRALDLVQQSVRILHEMPEKLSIETDDKGRSKKA